MLESIFIPGTIFVFLFIYSIRAGKTAVMAFWALLNRKILKPMIGNVLCSEIVLKFHKFSLFKCIQCQQDKKKSFSWNCVFGKLKCTASHVFFIYPIIYYIYTGRNSWFDFIDVLIITAVFNVDMVFKVLHHLLYCSTSTFYFHFALCHSCICIYRILCNSKSFVCISFTSAKIIVYCWGTANCCFNLLNTIILSNATSNSCA